MSKASCCHSLDRESEASVFSWQCDTRADNLNLHFGSASHACMFGHIYTSFSKDMSVIALSSLSDIAFLRVESLGRSLSADPPGLGKTTDG